MKKTMLLLLTLTIGATLFGQGLVTRNAKGVLTDPAVVITPGTINEMDFTVTFTPNAECAYYYILASPEGDMEMWAAMMGISVDELVASWGINYIGANTYTWTDMTPNTTYTIYALPFSSDSTMYPSNTATLITNAAGGSGLSELTVEITNITDSSALVTFTPNSETSSFVDGIIEKSLFDQIGMDSAVAIIKTSPYILYETDAWIWSGLAAATTFKAIGIGKNSNEEWGTPVIDEFTTLEALSISSLNHINNISIYPMPNDGNFNISSDKTDLHLFIYSISGKLILSQELTESSQNISTSLSSGSYIVRITNQHGTTMYGNKMIVIK